MLVEESDNMRIKVVKGLEDNQPYQYVEKYVYKEMPVIDVTDKTKKEVIDLIEEDLQKPITLFETELYQLKIYKLKNSSRIITIKIHHIIADAWTFKLMADRTLENYSRIKQDKLKAQTYSYLKTIRDESEYLKSNLFEKDKEYWEEYLLDIYEPAVLKDISLNQEICSTRVERTLPKKLYLNVLKYCQKNNITPYIFFLSLISIYLYKTTDKEEFTIGTPLLNRKNFQEKNTAGMYISTIPLKVQINSNTTIKDLTSTFLRDTRKALRHQRYPYLNMLEFVRKNNSELSNLFEVLVSFQNIKVGGTKDLPKATHIWSYNKNQQTQFEFHISQYAQEKPFVLGFDFKNDIATKAEQELIISRFIYLIENIVSLNNKKDFKIDELEYISTQELSAINKMMSSTNRNNRNGKNNKKLQTIKERFEKQAQKTPNKVAVKYKKESLTFQNLNKQANVLANKLIEQGVNIGDSIVVILDRGIEMAVSILGIIKAGAYFIPVATDWPYERVKYIVKDSNTKYIITEGKFLKNDYGAENFNIKELLKVDKETFKKIKNKKINLKRKDLLYVLYTSGSTGNPKGVLITHENVFEFLNGMQKMYHLEIKDNWSMFHSYTFDVSMWEFFGSLLTGGTLVIVPDNIKVDSKKMLSFLKNEKISILSQTPSYFYKLVVQDEKENLKEKDLKLKYIILGGETVYATPIQPWKNKYKKTKIMNGYRTN